MQQFKKDLIPLKPFKIILAMVIEIDTAAITLVETDTTVTGLVKVQSVFISQDNLSRLLCH